MSAAQLVIATPNRSLRNTAGLRMVAEYQERRSTDMVLAALNHVIAVLEGIASRRRRKQIARNRVETERELARLPQRVRDDVMFADPLIDHHV
ncbi:hypothetical protein QM996_08945 [Sinorhizobium chiapasense]